MMIGDTLVFNCLPVGGEAAAAFVLMTVCITQLQLPC